MGEAFRPDRERLIGEGQSRRERRGGRTGALDEGKSFDLAERVGLLGSLPHSMAVSGRMGAPWLPPSAAEGAVLGSPDSVSSTLREVRCLWALLADSGIRPRAGQGDSFGARPLCACLEGTTGRSSGAGPTALRVLTWPQVGVS